MSNNYTNDSELGNNFLDTFFLLLVIVVIISLCCNCIKKVRVVTQPSPIYINYDFYGSPSSFESSSDIEIESDQNIYSILPEQQLNEECCICQDKLCTLNSVKLDCNHFFHEECYNEWNDKNNECCLCRKKSKIDSYYLPIENMS